MRDQDYCANLVLSTDMTASSPEKNLSLFITYNDGANNEQVILVVALPIGGADRIQFLYDDYL